MKYQTRKVSLPKSTLTGNFRAESFNAETRTIDIVASVGAPVKRGGFFTEPFMQELEVSKRAIRLTRFENGAPLLDMHGMGMRDNNGRNGFGDSVRDVMGVVENPRIETQTVKRDGKKVEVPALVVTARFTDREEFAGVVRDIGNGIIRNASVGFKIHTNVEQAVKDGEIKRFVATDWEPMELSMVQMGADPDSVTRSVNNNHNDCDFQFINVESERGTALKNDVTNPPASGDTQQRADDQPTQKVDLDQVRKEAAEKAAADERQRSLDIRQAVKYSGLDSSVADEMIERGISADEARKEVLEGLAKKDKETETRSVQVEQGKDLSAEGMKRGIEAAMLRRMDPGFKLDEDQTRADEKEKLARPYKYMRLLDLSKECLEKSGVNTRGMPPMEIATRGLHSTTDFPEILANVVNKTMRRAYLESPATFAPFTRQVEVSDFKEISRTQLGDAAKLKKKQENGEYVSGTIAEAAEKYVVEEYGRIIPIGRRVIVNDDMNAFSQLPARMGIQARNLESNLIWTDLLSNPTMGDGIALFHASHGNLGAAAALSETTLSEARKLMRLQKGLAPSATEAGNELNIVPRWLFVPAALETTANKLLAQITPNATTDANMFGPGGTTTLRQGTEPRIDASSATEHYIMASLDQIDMYEMAFLTGERGPVTDSMIDFNTDGVKFKIRHSVGVKAIDYRGMVKNAGA